MVSTSQLSQKTICDGYVKLKNLGSGTYSKVKLVEKGGQKFAMKILRLSSDYSIKIR